MSKKALSKRAKKEQKGIATLRRSGIDYNEATKSNYCFICYKPLAGDYSHAR